MKIAYFDYWTKGIGNFTSYDKELRARGHQTLMLHIGSLRAPCAPEETFDGILCRDISYYNTRYFHQVLAQEKPDVLITLNAKSLMDRAVFLSCRQLGIKTIFISHGVNPYADELEMGVHFFEKSFNGFAKKLTRVGKYLRSVIPNYLYSQFYATHSWFYRLRSIPVMYTYFQNPGRSVLVPSYVDELVGDKILAFSKRAAEHFAKLGYPKERLRVVGNPKYDQTLRRKEHQDFRVEQLPPDVQRLLRENKPYALILDDAFPEAMNLGGWTNEYRNRHFQEITERLARDGYHTVIKLHPVTVIRDIEIRGATAQAYLHADLDALIHFADFCISHVSTTVENSVLLEKPVLQPHWELSRRIPDYFAKRLVSKYWRNLEDPLDLSIDWSARECHKRECITVVTPVAGANVIREITEWDAPHAFALAGSK